MTAVLRIFALIIVVFGLCSLPYPAFAQEDSQDPEHDHVSTVWTCSMHPQIQLPQFGQCPICFMDLIEVTVNNDQKAGLRQISFDQEARKLARVEVTPVIKKHIPLEIRMVGKVDYDETRVGSITAWVNGRIDKLYISYTGSAVRKGQPMAKIYSPELLTAQAELIQAVRAASRLGDSQQSLLKTTVARNEQASREKLRLLGLSEQQIKEVVSRKAPLDHITMTAPMSGIVIKKEVNEGRYVKTGTPIYTIADLSRLWIILEAYESDLHGLSLGQQVEFTVEAFPGDTFRAKVDYIDPLVDNRTRTVRIRLNVDNRQGKLKPGMLIRAQAKIDSALATDPPLLIPASAPLITGKRALIYVQDPEQEGVYEGREIILGGRRGEYYQVLHGLKEGELVVTRGNFKIDSAIQIQARPSMMNPFRMESKKVTSELAPLFLSRLELLNRHFKQYHLAVAEGDRLAQLRNLGLLSETLTKLDPDSLKDKNRATWQELSMLLQGDLILIAEADDEAERSQLNLALFNHFEQLRTWQPIHDTRTGHPGTEALRPYLGHFYQSYISLQNILFGDKPELLSNQITKLKQNGVPIWHKLASLEHQEAAGLSASLKESMEQLRDGLSLEEVRRVNLPLSTTLARILQLFGNDDIGPIFEQYCPMAFNNTGATWLASEENINNPYFGAVMPHCGEVRRQLAN